MTIAQSEGSVFLLYGGLRTWEFVCAGAGDITLPAGDTNTVYTLAPDFGRWEPSRIVRGAPGTPTTSITIRLQTAREKVLEIVRGPIAFRVNFSRYGARSELTNYQSAIILTGGEPTEKTISAPVSLDPSTDVINATVNFSFTDYLLWEQPARRMLSDQAVTAVNAEPTHPGSACEEEIECLQYLYAISATDFLRSKDGGRSWVSTALTITPVSVAKFGRYYFVGGGVAGAPAAIARSADGTTFTVTSLPTANNATVTSFARYYDGTIYATTSDGAIFSSTNSGGSWAKVYSNTTPLNRITAGKVWVVAVGDAGKVVYGRGSAFSSVTIGAANFVGVAENWRNLFVLVTDTNAVLWSPTVTATPVTIGTNINSVAFIHGIMGIAASPSTLYLTEDGGVSWYELVGLDGGSNIVSVDCDSWLMVRNGIAVVEPTRVIC